MDRVSRSSFRPGVIAQWRTSLRIWIGGWRGISQCRESDQPAQRTRPTCVRRSPSRLRTVLSWGADRPRPHDDASRRGAGHAATVAIGLVRALRERGHRSTYAVQGSGRSRSRRPRDCGPPRPNRGAIATPHRRLAASPRQIPRGSGGQERRGSGSRRVASCCAPNGRLLTSRETTVLTTNQSCRR